MNGLICPSASSSSSSLASSPAQRLLPSSSACASASPVIGQLDDQEQLSSLKEGGELEILLSRLSQPSQLSSTSSKSEAQKMPSPDNPNLGRSAPPPAQSSSWRWRPSHLWKLSSIGFCFESCLSWLLAVACLAVSGYYYLACKCRYFQLGVCLAGFPFWQAEGEDDGNDLRWIPWMPPLVMSSTVRGTGSRLIISDKENCWLLLDRVFHLIANFERHGKAEEESKKRVGALPVNSLSVSSKTQSISQGLAFPLDKLAERERDASTTCQISDNQLVSWIQTDFELRRAVSDLVQLLQRTSPRDHPTGPGLRRHSLCRQVLRVYPRLLELPPPSSVHSGMHQLEISLIVPYYDPESDRCFKPIGCSQKLHRKHRRYQVQEERATTTMTTARQLLEETIEHARVHCEDPGTVELVVVHSIDEDHRNAESHDDNDRLSPFLNASSDSSRNDSSHCLCDHHDWGSTVLRVVRNRGRGPCLNEGARSAAGRILVFCHADTKLPAGWDASIRDALHDCRQMTTGEVVLATAFRFGIDGGERATGAQPKRPTIPGLRAVEATANWRSRWFSLPYGDQCISVSAGVFRHVGGFPDVPLMEDYELIRFFRQRQLATRVQNGSTHFHQQHQRIVILPQQVRCSSRRWERYGVPRVTLTNSMLVWAYQSGRATADEIYQRYYGVPCSSASSA